jgi:para-nitrobenzyl esterase
MLFVVGGVLGFDDAAFDPAPVRLSPPGQSYVDPEVLQVDGRLVFQTGGGSIWVAELDPVTGLFRSEDGKDSLVDTGASPVALTWSGPEFGVDASGWSVFYAKPTVPGESPQIWRATPVDDGWLTEPLTSGEPHQTQLATKSLTRTGTRIMNLRGTWSEGTIEWFSETEPADAHPLIVIDDETFGRTPARWSGDGRLILYRDAMGRIHRVDADTGVTGLVVDDGRSHDDPNAWSAPEFDGERVLATVVDDTGIAIHRESDDGLWTPLATLEVPQDSSLRYYGSPEALVVGGRSYLSVAVKNQPNHGDATPTDSEIWIIGIEPGADGAPQFARRCDDGAPGLFRSDPETFIGSDEVFVYYNLIDLEGGSDGRSYQAWRARTGIPSGVPAPEVTVETGTLRGFVDGGTHAFRGIPYAAAPVGDLRWRPPQPAYSWGDVREAVFYGSPAPQTLASRVGGEDRVVGEEDCLFLNVWTPADRLPGERLPVVFFVHGGGNMSGASSEPVDSILELTDGPSIYEGAGLAERGRVVVVTVNYRLGPLGYLALPGLDAENLAAGGAAVSGNYGILDQQAALRWVRRNVEVFGGDPDRVMIVGQSGGARNISVHLASPRSAGFFSAAVMHSGVTSVRTRRDLDGFGVALLDELGFRGDEPDLLDRLREVTPETLVTSEAAQPLGLGSMTFSPHVDGDVLADQPSNVLYRGEGARVSFVIGATTNEYGHRFTDVPDSGYEPYLIGLFGPALAADVMSRYPLEAFASASEAIAVINTDRNLICSTRRAAAWAVHGDAGPVFRYIFDRTMSSDLRLADGPYHTSDLLFLFQHFANGDLDGSDGDRAVDEFLRDAWTHLAATGTPDVAWHPAWPEYDPALDPAMVISAEPGVQYGFRADRCAFWDEVIRSASRPPELELPSTPVDAIVGWTTEIRVGWSDADGDHVDLLVDGLPPGAVLEPATGTITWRPGPSDVGTLILDVTARDLRGASSQGTIEIRVSAELPEPRDPSGRTSGGS